MEGLFSLRRLGRKLAWPGLACNLVFGLHFGTAFDQRWQPAAGVKPEQLEPGPGEISVDRAVASCRDFLRRLGLPAPTALPLANRFPEGGRPGGTVYLKFKDEAGFLVAGRSGEVVYYTNDRRMAEHREGRAWDGPFAISGSVQARAYGNAVMKRLEMPAGCKIVELEFRHFPGAREPFDPEAFPRVDIVYQPKPYGYRIEGSYGRRDLGLDAADGTVVDYVHRQWPEIPYTVETHDPVLRAKEARANLAPLAKAFGIGEAHAAGGSALNQPGKAELRLVVPNGVYGGVKYDRDERPVRMRLAWVFIFETTQEAWIDAVDGRVLGGYYR